MTLFVLMFWVAFGAYTIGKRSDKGMDYALASIPISLVSYFLIYMGVAVIH